MSILKSPSNEFVSSVYSLFSEFHSAYASEWTRLDKCEQAYRGDHWDDVEKKDDKEPRPVTPVIHSTIENIAADLMDNIPEAIIRPETPEDEEVARVVDALIRQNQDATSYPREYQKLAHDLLTSGYMVHEVGYDTTLNNGIGGAFKRYVDIRNILFDPQCSDIQDGRAAFKIASKTIKWLEAKYPQYKGEFSADEYKLQEDNELQYDQTKSRLMIEYWWREYDEATGMQRVHMATVAGHKLLEDSRENKPEGYFSHGKYPFVVTPLYPRKGSALGYGIVDINGEQALYADKLDQINLMNAYMAAQNKLLIEEGSGFDSDDLRDWSKSVHTGNNVNGVKWFTTPPLPNYTIQYAQSIRQNIREESGANDFSRGNASGGVTAASAISALVEMSNKRSRMAARQMHEAYKDAVRMEIEVEREWNVLPRQVMLTNDGEQSIGTFDSMMLQKQSKASNTMVPIEFQISIKVQRENRWNIIAHNELVLQMVKLQVIQPQQAAELMVFEGKELLLKKAQAKPQITPEQEQALKQQQEQQRMAQAVQQMPTPEQAIA